MKEYVMKMDERIVVAKEKAIEVIEKLKYDGSDMIDTDRVKEIVSEMTGINISVGRTSFSNLDGDNRKFGAMMRVNSEEKEAYIILNNDVDPRFRRFSFVHELGHIITNKYNFLVNDKQYTISAHINYDVTSIDIKDSEEDSYLINEQIANVFALLVLMPGNFFVNKLKALDSINDTAEFFGITSEAVLSRIRLGE